MTHLNDNKKLTGNSKLLRGFMFILSFCLFTAISVSDSIAQDGSNGNKTKTDSLKFQNRTENTTIWNPNGDNIYYSGGFVGIGTDAPERVLHMVDEKAMLRLDRNHPSGHDPAVLLVNRLTTGEVQRSWMLSGGINGFSVSDYGDKTGGSNNTKVLQITPDHRMVLGDVSAATEKMEVAGSVKSDGSILRAGDGGSLKMEFNNTSSKIRFKYSDNAGTDTNIFFLEKDGDLEVTKDLKAKAVLTDAINIDGAIIYNDPAEDDLYFDAPTGVHELFFRGYNVQLTEGKVTAQSFLGAADDLTVGGTKLSDLLSGGGSGPSVWNSATAGQISYAGGDVRVSGGGVIAEKVVATVDPTTFTWPDYVFSNDYNLPTLESVESFIKKESHLPGVPSAEEVYEEGVDFAKMDASILEKVEQLMLYTIEQNKQLQQQNEELTKLKARIAELESDNSNK